MIENRQVETRGQTAGRAVAGLRDDGDRLGLRAIQHEHRLGEGLGSGARLGDDQKAGAVAVRPAENAIEAIAVAVIQEQQSLAIRPGRGERLTAEIGATGAKHDEAAVSLAPRAGQRLQRCEIVAGIGERQERMRILRARPPQPVERAGRFRQQFFERCASNPAKAHSFGEAEVRVLLQARWCLDG